MCNGDFVIVNEKHQTEFDKFKKKFFSILDLCPTGPRTVIKATAIMNIWMKFCNLSLKSMHVLGGNYYLISSSEMDYFCQWIHDTRDAYEIRSCFKTFTAQVHACTNKLKDMQQQIKTNKYRYIFCQWHILMQKEGKQKLMYLGETKWMAEDLHGEVKSHHQRTLAWAGDVYYDP